MLQVTELAWRQAVPWKNSPGSVACDAPVRCWAQANGVKGNCMHRDSFIQSSYPATTDGIKQLCLKQLVAHCAEQACTRMGCA